MMFIGTTIAVAQGETCATAVSVTSGVHNADGPTSGAGTANACFAFGTGTNSDWYSFTPACDGVITVSSDYIVNGSGFDSRLSIYSGDCNALVCEGNDDDGGTIVNFASKVTNLSVAGGTTYFIEWDDRWGNGAIPFEWTLDYQLNGGVGNPSSLPSINTSTLTWITSSANEIAWDIEWGPAGFGLGSGNNFSVDTSVAGNGTGHFTTISGLLPETTYDFYISVGGEGCYVGPISFTTLPLCPEPTNITSTPGNTDLLLDWDPGNVETEWDLQYGTAGTIIGAGTINNGLTTSTYTATGLASCEDYHWYVRAVCDNFTPTLYSNWVGPNIVSTDCVCPEPSGLTAETDILDAFNSILNWTSNGTETEWSVYYIPAGGLIGGPGWTGPVTATTNPFTVTGLNPDTEYDFYITADCGTTADSTSVFVGPATMTTGTFCTEPTGLGISNLTTLGADLDWATDGSTSDWTLEWGPAGFTQGSGTISTLSSNNVTLTGLTPDTEYCYYVQSNCGATAELSSLWAGPYCFTTLAACPAPTSLDAFNITTTAANLDWQAGTGLTDFTVQWGAPGFTPDDNQAGSGTTTGGITQFYATGLNGGAPYEFYVQTNCGGTSGNSIWTGPFSFTTLLVNDLACSAVQLAVDGVVNVHTNIGATVNGEGAIIPPLSFSHTQLNWYSSSNTMQAPVWFKFIAPSSGKVAVSTINDVTTTANTRTEIAVYETGNCAIFANYNLLAANTFGAGFFGPAGSEVLLCDLDPEQEYYVVVDVYNTTFTPGPNGTFGISVTDIPENNSGIATPITVCGDGTAIDLFTIISGNSTNTGTWYNPGIVNPSLTLPGATPMVTLPAGAGVYTFDYLIANACGSDTTQSTITTIAPPSAGMDGSFTACNTEDIILLNHLNGIIEMGGTWADVNGAINVVNGIFNAYSVPYGTYNFTYTVTGDGTCPPDVATVTITLNDDCLGLEDNETTPSFAVFPNPVNDVLTIAKLDITGAATVSVYDAQGKAIITRNISNQSGNYSIDMTGFASGVYMVEVTSDSNTENVRVVKK